MTEVEPYRIKGTLSAVTRVIANLDRQGVLFEYSITGWTADPLTSDGHIEACCIATLTPDDDCHAVILRMMLPKSGTRVR